MCRVGRPDLFDDKKAARNRKIKINGTKQLQIVPRIWENQLVADCVLVWPGAVGFVCAGVAKPVVGLMVPAPEEEELPKVFDPFDKIPVIGSLFGFDRALRTSPTSTSPSASSKAKSASLFA